MAGHVPDGARRAFAQRPTAFGPGATAEPGMAESGNRLGTRLAGRRPLAARLPVPRAAELSAVASEHRRQLIPRPAQVHPEEQPASRRLLLARGRWGYRMGDGELYDSVLRDGLNDAFSDAHSGWHTEDLAEKHQVTREAQDRWALRSQQRFAAAQAAGHFNAQIVPVEVPGKKGPTPFDKDEHNRPDTTLETLARLKPAFRPNGTITAGNAPGLNDAAAAMVLADGDWADQRGLASTA